MASKFNVVIGGDSGHIIVGDYTKVDINTTSAPRQAGRGHRQQPNFTVHKGTQRSPLISQPQQSGIGNYQESSVEHSDMHYKVTQGYALIIHNHIFDNMPDRTGSEKDVAAIEELCRNAGLRINDTEKSTENLTATQMDNLCEEISKRDFTRYDSFFCFILSHGSDKGILGVDNIEVGLQKMISKFRDVKALIGKPKLFFIQACRGTKQDGGMEADSQPTNQKTPPLRLPSESDMLVVHSSVYGYESYRSLEHGTWFIMTLVEQLNKHAYHMHLLDILTHVNNKIAGYETNGKKQMPCQMSTLTKFVYLNLPPPSS